MREKILICKEDKNPIVVPECFPLRDPFFVPSYIPKKVQIQIIKRWKNEKEKKF